MRLGTQTHNSRALLDSLERILDLVQPSLRGEYSVVRVVGIPKL